MKQYLNQQIPHFKVLISLLLTAIIASACSIIAEPEDTQPTFDGPPVVNIAAPQPNDSYYEEVAVNIVLRVENAGPDIARVSISVDGQIIGEAPLPNASGAPSFVVANGWTASGVGSHTIGVVASRNDGTQSNPAQVTINVVAAPERSDTQTTNNTTAPTQAPIATVDTQSVQPQPTIAPTNTSAPVVQEAPSNTPEPTAIPPTSTPSKPQVRVVTGANIRRGASTAFEPPIGSLAAGATEDLLAISTDGLWYKISYYNGEGWIFANTVEVVGDSSNIPREAGPPTPIPATATPVQTATPVAVADLSIVSWSTAPFPLICGENSVTTVTIVNSGSGNSGATKVRLEDFFNDQSNGSATADVRGLGPNESTTVNINLTVSSNHSQGHRLRVRVDPDNSVAETNENNNQREANYNPLEPGDCP